MSTYTLKEAASLKNPEAWIALMQIEYKCDHEKPQNLIKYKYISWNTQDEKLKLLTAKKNPVFPLSSQLFLKDKKTSQWQLNERGSNDMPRSSECCFIRLEN